MRQDTINKLYDQINQIVERDGKPLSFRDAASYLGFSRSHLFKLTHKKLIPFYEPTGKMI